MAQPSEIGLNHQNSQIGMADVLQSLALPDKMEDGSTLIAAMKKDMPVACQLVQVKH